MWFVIENKGILKGLFAECGRYSRFDGVTDLFNRAATVTGTQFGPIRATITSIVAATVIETSKTLKKDRIPKLKKLTSYVKWENSPFKLSRKSFF